jgi:hypothetical protein
MNSQTRKEPDFATLVDTTGTETRQELIDFAERIARDERHDEKLSRSSLSFVRFAA